MLSVRTVVTPRENPETLKHCGETIIWKLLWTREESCSKLWEKNYSEALMKYKANQIGKKASVWVTDEETEKI